MREAKVVVVVYDENEKLQRVFLVKMYNERLCFEKDNDLPYCGCPDQWIRSGGFLTR